MIKATPVNLSFISAFLMLVFASASFAQEFDWNDPVLQGRQIQPGQSETYAESDLPGVRKNPFADRQKGVDCVEATVSGQIPSSTDCDQRWFCHLLITDRPGERRVVEIIFHTQSPELFYAGYGGSGF